MGGQVVGDDPIRCLPIKVDHVVQIFQMVVLGPRWAKHRREQFTRRHMQVAEKADRAMPSVFILAKHRQARSRKKVRSNPLKSLASRLFVDANGVKSLLFKQSDGIPVNRTDLSYRLTRSCMG